MYTRNVKNAQHYKYDLQGYLLIYKEISTSRPAIREVVDIGSQQWATS